MEKESGGQSVVALWTQARSAFVVTVLIVYVASVSATLLRNWDSSHE